MESMKDIFLGAADWKLGEPAIRNTRPGIDSYYAERYKTRSAGVWGVMESMKDIFLGESNKASRSSKLEELTEDTNISLDERMKQISNEAKSEFKNINLDSTESKLNSMEYKSDPSLTVADSAVNPGNSKTKSEHSKAGETKENSSSTVDSALSMGSKDSAKHSVDSQMDA